VLGACVEPQKITKYGFPLLPIISNNNQLIWQASYLTLARNLTLKKSSTNKQVLKETLISNH